MYISSFVLFISRFSHHYTGQEGSQHPNSRSHHKPENMDAINKLALGESPRVASQLMLDYWLYTQQRFPTQAEQAQLAADVGFLEADVEEW